MIPVSVAMEEFNLSTGSHVGRFLDGIKELTLADDSSCGDRGVREALGTGDHVGSDAELDRTEGSTNTTETSDDFIEN